MEYLPPRLSLASLRKAAAHCRGCDLYRTATQTVFGQGKARARFMLVGEQPGDKEDPNAVKHFKFVVRGKRRIHQKPKVIEIAACRPWLEAEISVVHPQLVVALGATASRSLLGAKFRLTKQRGELILSPLARVMATIHPSAILRSPSSDERHREFRRFVEDLRRAAEYGAA